MNESTYSDDVNVASEAQDMAHAAPCDCNEKVPAKAVEETYVYKEPDRDAAEKHVQTVTYYTQPVPAAEPPKKKVRQGVPGSTAFGFTSSLLSLFLVPFFKEAFTNYLTYAGNSQLALYTHYYSTMALGIAGAVFALLGLICSPIGMRRSKVDDRDGRGLGVAGMLIAVVAIILLAAVFVPHFLLYREMFLS